VRPRNGRCGPNNARLPCPLPRPVMDHFSSARYNRLRLEGSGRAKND
jgi:hypothetical protein